MMFNEAATNIGKGNCLVTQGQFDGNRVERERERERRGYTAHEWVGLSQLSDLQRIIDQQNSTLTA